MRTRFAIYYILLIASFMMATSCKVVQETKEKHTVHETHSYIDSTILTKKEILDTAWINESVASDSINLELLKQLGRLNISNDRAHTTVVYNEESGKIHIDTKCDAAFKVFIKSTIEEITTKIQTDLSKQIDQKLETKTVEQLPFKSFLNGALTGAGVVLVLVLVIYLYRKFYRI